jgi:hypothetical protein
MTSTMNRAEMTARRTAEIADSSDMVQAVGAYIEK